MTTLASFGSYFKKKRQERGLTLRNFCSQYGLDPGNISKMERGLILPPSKREILEKYAEHLDIKEGSDDWYEFFDLAAAFAGRIPTDVMNDERLVEKLPVVFRTLRGQKVPKEQLEDLAELIRRS